MTKPSWGDLNAYVDGELTAAEAAEIAAEIAADRELAGRVAALARLKAATGEALAVEPAEVPHVRLPPARGRHSASRPELRRWPAIAAGIVLAAAIGIAGWLAMPGADASQAWLEAAEAKHLDWLAEDPDPVPLDERTVVLADAPDTPRRVPELGVARLTMAHLAVDASGRRPGLYVGYVGVNGCRLGLWIGPAAEGLATELTEHRDAALHSFTWRVGDMGYAVIARDMDARRLAGIAAHLERLTRSGPETRVAARDDAATDAPCAA